MIQDSSAQTLKKVIVGFFGESTSFHFGGNLEQYMRDKTGCKGETTGRLCRFLVRDGILESRVVAIEVDGRKKRAVQYRVKPANGAMF